MGNIRTNQANSVAASLLVAALVVAMALVGFSTWQIWALHDECRRNGTRNARLMELVGILADLDAAQTAAAQAATATWDLRWEDQFGASTSRLESAVEQILELSPDTELSRAAAGIQAANVKLVTTAGLAIDLAARGHRDDARRLLEADEFDQQQQLYRQGLRQLRELVVARIELGRQWQLQHTFAAFVAGGAALPFLLIGCLGLSSAARVREPPDWPDALAPVASAATPSAEPTVEAVVHLPPADPALAEAEEAQAGSRPQEFEEAVATDATPAEAESEMCPEESAVGVASSEEAEPEATPVTEQRQDSAPLPEAESGQADADLENVAEEPASEVADGDLIEEEVPAVEDHHAEEEAGDPEVVVEQYTATEGTADTTELEALESSAEQAAGREATTTGLDQAAIERGKTELIDEPATIEAASEAVEQAVTEDALAEAAGETWAEPSAGQASAETPTAEVATEASAGPADELEAALAAAESAFSAAAGDDQPGTSAGDD